jgi:hypothetical protein
VRVRWILAAAGVTLGAGLLAVIAAVRFVVPQLQNMQLGPDATQEQLDAHFAELSATWLYAQIFPWLATATLIALVGTLALLALRARLGAHLDPKVSIARSEVGSAQAGSASEIAS